MATGPTTAQFPIAAGTPNIADYNVSGMVPTLWSKLVNVKFFRRTVFGAIANTKWEGEVKNYGDTVVIRNDPDITISNYRKDGNLNYERPTAAPTILPIDKGKSWSFSTNAIDTAQTDMKNYAARWTSTASKQLTIQVDSDVLDNVYTDAHASNTGATAGAVSGDINLGTIAGSSVQINTSTVITKMVEANQVLAEQDIPVDDEQFFVVPPWFKSKLMLSDLKNASITGDSTSPMRNGLLGMIGEFKVYVSNNLLTATDGDGNTATYCYFGTRDAITFAGQTTQNQIIDNPFDFGKWHRGLFSYGYKVVKPEALGVLICRPVA